MIMTDQMREAARQAAREHAARAEAAAKALLGQWVSGLEPRVAYDEEYRVIGLSYGNSIVIHAEPHP
ncbi:hypothetical protein C0214_19745 [Methylobacterium sp. DM1]|nr:hypothetical protein C0214_19745 [Methylobacterium sp. DM1]